jgi:hypothetical protein
MFVLERSVFAGQEVSMMVKNGSKRLEFIDQDEGFIKKLADDIGCHYFKTNERTYNLNKFATDIHSEMGVFAWVHKEGSDCYWISTRKNWVEEARAKAIASGQVSGISCFTRDTRQAEDSVSFDTQDGYEKTVSALRLINEVR